MKHKLPKALALIIASMTVFSTAAVRADEPTAFNVGKIVSPSADKFVKVGGINYIITKDPSNIPGKCTVSVNTLSTEQNIVIPSQIIIQGKQYNVTEIADNAFAENKYVRSIIIGSKVDTIAPTAFAGAATLESISVEIENNSFTAVDGILYTKDKTTVVSCPMAKKISTYTAPDTVTKIAPCAFYGNHSLYNVILNNMKINEIGDFAFTNCNKLAVCNMGHSINKIGMAAFSQTDLKNLVLPIYLKEIGSGAFAGTKIESVNVPGEVKEIPYGAFSNCVYLKDAKWGVNLEAIGDYAFANTALTSVKITDFVKSIGYCAFTDCSSLKSVTFGKRLNTIGDYAFSDCGSIMNISIPSSVIKIGEAAFFHCEKLLNIHVDASNPNYTADDGVLYSKGKAELLLYPAARMNTEYTIPTETVNIRSEALTDARYLTDFTVADGNQSFKSEDGVLYSIDGYELIRFPMGKNYNGYSVPDNVYKIRSSAFYGSVITGVLNISSNVKEIGANAFTNCSNVTYFNVSDLNPAYKTADGVLYTKDMAHLINYPINKTAASFEIPEEVNVIEPFAFLKTSVSEIKIPETLVEIGESAFANSKVSQINLPSSLKLIDDEAFYNTFLTDITIPGSVTEIGEYAFSENAFLSSVTFTGTPSIVTVGANVFAGDSSLLKISVPAPYVNEYKIILINMDIDNYSDIMVSEN